MVTRDLENQFAALKRRLEAEAGEVARSR